MCPVPGMKKLNAAAIAGLGVFFTTTSFTTTSRMGWSSSWAPPFWSRPQ